MKSSQWFCFIAILSIPTLSFTQEWQLFTASDAVSDFCLVENELWIISGSGLSKVDIHTGARITWDLVNSDIPDYAFDEITVDPQGRVWLGERYGSMDDALVMFDGNTWHSFTHINGYEIGAIRDLMTTPDG